MFNLIEGTMKIPNRPLYTVKKLKKLKKVNRPPNKDRLSNVAGVVSDVMLKNPNYSSTRDLAALRKTSRLMRTLIPTKDIQKSEMKFMKDQITSMVRNSNKPVSNDNRAYASINRELAERIYMKNFVNKEAFKADYKNALNNLNGTNYQRGKVAYNKIITSMVRASHRAMGLS
jgi:hypothetical protein